MAKMNGNLKWIALVVGLIVTALTTMNALGVFQGEVKKDIVHIHEAIEDVQDEQLLQWVDIDSNMKHQYIFEEKVNNIQTDITEILKEVKKLGGNESP